MTSAQDVFDLSRAILADQEGVIAVLKVYMDESGTHDQSPVLTVGAYVAHPRIWRDWTKAWNIQKKPIDVFHSTDCANLRGEFSGWSSSGRDEYVEALLPIIGKSDLMAFVVGIVMDDYREVREEHPDIIDKLGNPYAACFQWVVHLIIDGFRRNNIKDRIAFFHECNDYQGEAINCFGYLKNEWYADQILSLAFGSKQDYVPLQAADILAYEGNKRLRDREKADRRAWTAINPDSNRRHTAYFDKSALQELVSDAKRRPDHYFVPEYSRE